MAGTWGRPPQGGLGGGRPRTEAPPPLLRGPPAGPPLCSHGHLPRGTPRGAGRHPGSPGPPVLLPPQGAARPPPHFAFPPAFQPESPPGGPGPQDPDRLPPHPKPRARPGSGSRARMEITHQVSSLAVHTAKGPPPPSVSPGGPRAASKASGHSNMAGNWLICSSEEPGRGNAQRSVVSASPLPSPNPRGQDPPPPPPPPPPLFTGDSTATGIVLRPKPQLRSSHTHTCPASPACL